MKIYTRTGDDGTTGLVGGARAAKDDPRLDCVGTVDELNAAVGLACTPATEPALVERLRRVQGELFVLGAHLATPAPTAQTPRRVSLPELDETMVARLEAEIDAADAVLPPLRNFILPGGGEPAARLHLARAVCRRAERLVVSLTETAPPLDPLILRYLNRLSDWLFVQARWWNHLANVADIPWVAEKKS